MILGGEECNIHMGLVPLMPAIAMVTFMLHVENGAAVGPIAVATPAAAPTYAVAAAKPAAVAVASAPAPATAAVRSRGSGEGFC